MSILPINEKKKTIDVPRNFFIYGATMSGKSYLAQQFPNPLFLNTDGNALANPFPSIQLKNNANENVLRTVDEIITALRNGNNKEGYGYETIIVDVIDDLIQLFEQGICQLNNVNSLSEIGFGKGFATFKSVINNFINDLKGLGLNVVYISRVDYVQDQVNDTVKEVPSLPTKFYNVVNGNCDLVIHTEKIGKNYLQTATNIRKKYYLEDMNNKKIATILHNIPGALYRKEEPKKAVPKKNTAAK